MMNAQRLRGLGAVRSVKCNNQDQVRVRAGSDCVYLSITTIDTLQLDEEAARYLAECLINAANETNQDG